MRFLALAVLLIATACASPTPQTLAFSVAEESYGIYEGIKNQESHLLETTEEIPCELGLSFGVKMTLTLESDSGGRVPLGGEMRNPPVEGLRPALKQIVPDPLIVPDGAASASFSIGYTFDVPEEMVSGIYGIRFFDRATGETLHERNFRVTGCP